MRTASEFVDAITDGRQVDLVVGAPAIPEPSFEDVMACMESSEVPDAYDMDDLDVHATGSNRIPLRVFVDSVLNYGYKLHKLRLKVAEGVALFYGYTYWAEVEEGQPITEELTRNLVDASLAALGISGAKFSTETVDAPNEPRYVKIELVVPLYNFTRPYTLSSDQEST